MTIFHDQYATPAMVALRTAPGASLCTDPYCDLSGGYAHVGPCEPCGCGAEHAIDECPSKPGSLWPAPWVGKAARALFGMGGGR